MRARDRGELAYRLIRQAARHPIAYRAMCDALGRTVTLLAIDPSVEGTGWTLADLRPWRGERGVRVAVVLGGELLHIVAGDNLRGRHRGLDAA